MQRHDFCAKPPAFRTATLVFLAVLSLYAATAGGSLATQDASAVFAQTRSLVDYGTLDVPLGISGPDWRGIDGRYHLPFGIGQALYNAPFYAAGKLAVRLTGLSIGGSDEPVLKASVLLGNAVAGSLCAAVVFLLAWRLTGHERNSVATAALFACGSLAWTYSKFGFSAMPTALMLAAGVYGVWSGVMLERLAPVARGGAALAFAFLIRHEMLLAGAVCVLWTVSAARPRRRRLQVGCLAAMLGVAVAGWAWYNLARFGNPFETGHHPEFGGLGLLGLTVSPAASVFLYAPLAGIGAIVLIRLWRNDHSYARLVVPASAALFAFYALLEDWLGTRSYGPRYLVPLLALTYAPLALVPALGWRTWATRLAIGVAGTQRRSAGARRARQFRDGRRGRRSAVAEQGALRVAVVAPGPQQPGDRDGAAGECSLSRRRGAPARETRGAGRRSRQPTRLQPRFLVAVSLPSRQAHGGQSARVHGRPAAVRRPPPLLRPSYTPVCCRLSALSPAVRPRASRGRDRWNPACGPEVLAMREAERIE